MFLQIEDSTIRFGNVFSPPPIKAMKYPLIVDIQRVKASLQLCTSRVNSKGSVVSERGQELNACHQQPTIDDLIVNASRASFCTMHVQSATGRSN